METPEADKPKRAQKKSDHSTSRVKNDSIPTWVANVVAEVAFSEPTIISLSKKYGRSTGTIYRYLQMESVQKMLDDKRKEIDKVIDEKLRMAAGLAMDTFIKILKELPIKNKIRYDTARDILKGTGKLNENLQLSGLDGAPLQVEFVSAKSNSDEPPPESEKELSDKELSAQEPDSSLTRDDASS